MLRSATGVLFILVIAKSVSQIAQQSRTAKRDGEVILSISDTLKKQYLRQNVTSDVYRYGYDVDSNGQFHHEIRGPDGITYGCYGYVDPFHRLKTTFYLSDGWGYRVVNPGKDVELFLHEHEHHVGGSEHDHHGVITSWKELHFPGMCAEYAVSKIPSAGTPIGKGSIIDASSTRPPYKPALDGKPNLHGVLEEHTPTAGYPGRANIPGITHISRNRPGVSRLLSRPEQPRTFAVSETPDTPGTPVYPGQIGDPGTLDTPRTFVSLQRPEKPGKSETIKTIGTPETSGSLAYHGQPINSEISDTPGVPESSYPGQHGTGSPGTPGTHGLLGTLGTSRRPVMPAQPGQPGIPETFGIPVISATPKLLQNPQYSGTPGAPGISGTSETVGSSGSLAYPKQPGSLEKSDTSEVAPHPKQFGVPGTQEISGSQSGEKPGISGTFDVPGILFIPGLSDTKISKISGVSGTAKTQGSLAHSKQPNSSGISDTLATSGLSLHYPGLSGSSRTSGTPAVQATPGRLVIPSYAGQIGTAKALNISIISATPRLPPYLEYVDTPGAPESSNISVASLTSRQPDIPRIPNASSTLGLLPRQRQPINTSKTSGILKTSGALNYSAQTFVTKAPDSPGIPGKAELSPHRGQFGILNTPESPIYSEQPGVPEISGTSGTPGVSFHREQLGTIGTAGKPGDSVYSKQFGVSRTSDIPSISESSQEHSGTSSTSGRSGSLVYSKQSGVSRISDISGTPGVSSHQEQLGTIGTAGRPGDSVYSKQFGVSRISDTPSTSGSSQEHSGTSSTSGRSGSLIYSKQSDVSRISDISGTSGISFHREQLGTIGAAGRPRDSVYSKQFGVSRISDTPSTSGSSQEHSDTSSTSGGSGSLMYSKQSDVSRISDIPGTPGISFHREQFGTVGTAGRPGDSVYSKQFGVSRISDTPSTSGSSQEHSGTSSTSGRSGSLIYSKQSDVSRISDISGTSGISFHREQLGTIGAAGRPRDSVYSKQFGVSRISDTPSTSGSSQEHSGTSSTSGRSGSLMYSKQSDVSRISDISGTSGISFHREQLGTIGAAGRPGGSVYSKHLDISGIPDTSGTPESSSHPEQLGKPDTPDSRRISGKSFLPAYSEQQGISKSSFSGGSISGSTFYREHSDAPGVPRKLETFAYSKTLSDKVISSKHGRLGNSKRPAEFESSGEVVGSVGGIDGVSREGDAGSDGPNGPWPTGSPGPNGPWPGDPDYLPGIEPTRRPSQTGSIKHHHSKTYPLDTDNYKSVAQYYFRNKTEPLYADYGNIKLEFSHSRNASVPLYTKQKPQYKIESTSSIYEKEDTYGAGEINSLLQTGSTSPLSKDSVKGHKDADFVKQPPQAYDHVSHRIEQSHTGTPLKQDSELLSVHDRGQYQKSVFYPKSQFSKGRYDKLGRQESSFNIRGQYSNSDTDSKTISNASFQSDGSTAGTEKQVNSGLEQSFRANPGLDAIGIHPPGFINVKPFPLPIGPDPQACPCYLVGPGNNTNVATIRSTSNPVIGQVGFIPVIFVPYCPGDETDRKTKAIFPSATPVPYACDACGARDTALGIKPLDISQLGNINYLKEVLKQANLGFLNVPVKTSANGRRSGAENGVRNA